MEGKVTWDKRGQPHYWLKDDRGFYEVPRTRFDEAMQVGEFDAGDGSQLTAWKRPIYSDALGVHPAQIERAMALDRAHGVSSEYLADGRMVLRNREERRKVMGYLGLHDNNGGYGDDHAATSHPGYGDEVSLPDDI